MSQRLQALQEHKKGLLQLLFPPEGKRMPKLRFPEFQDAPEWSLTFLGLVLSEKDTEKFMVSEPINQKKGTPVLTAKKDFLLGYTNETDGIYKDLPVIILDDISTEMKYIDFPFKVKSEKTIILKNKYNKNNNLRLIFELMNKTHFRPQNSKQYYKSEYKKLPIFLPTENEQNKLGELLISLDELMASEEEKILGLEEYKKELLQANFISTNEVAL